MNLIYTPVNFTLIYEKIVYYFRNRNLIQLGSNQSGRHSPIKQMKAHCRILNGNVPWGHNFVQLNWLKSYENCKKLYGVLHKFGNFFVFFSPKSAPVCSGCRNGDNGPYLMTNFFWTHYSHRIIVANMKRHMDMII